MRKRALLATSFAAVLALSACSSDSADTTAAPAETEAAVTEAIAPETEAMAAETEAIAAETEAAAAETVAAAPATDVSLKDVCPATVAIRRFSPIVQLGG